MFFVVVLSVFFLECVSFEFVKFVGSATPSFFLLFFLFSFFFVSLIGFVASLSLSLIFKISFIYYYCLPSLFSQTAVGTKRGGFNLFQQCYLCCPLIISVAFLCSISSS